MNRFTILSLVMIAMASTSATAALDESKEGKQSVLYKQVDDSCDPINTAVDDGKHCAVCQAYLKVLNTLDEPVQCDIPTNPQLGFYPVKWKKLDPWTDPQLLYGLDTYARPNARRVLPGDTKPTRYKDMTFEQWKWAIEQEIAEGRKAPEIVEANLDLNGDEKTETVLGYSSNPQGCKNAIAKGWSGGGGRYHLFVRSNNPPGFDVKASKKIVATRLFTPMRHDGRIYSGRSLWDALIIPNRDSAVSLFEFWGKPVHATVYCRYKMGLPIGIRGEVQ